MEVSVRPARLEDQPAITAMVRQARLNPRDLQWSRFMVADDGGTIAGVGQIRVYPDGTHELASLVVQPASRGQGVATSLVAALLAADHGEVYTLIDRRYTGHFERWEFREADPAHLPRSLVRVYRIGRIVTGVASVLLRRRIRIVPLKRPTTGR